jgi:serine/threonine-protein kinase HipA
MPNGGLVHESVRVLMISLHGSTVGYLAGYAGGRNILTFAPEYRANDPRPTFTLTTHPDFPRAAKLLSAPWLKQQRLHPVLSNLLPEGVLRELLAQALKTHTDNEFELFAHLGLDLPGAIIATALEPAEVPAYALEARTSVEPVPVSLQNTQTHCSLAGVQMKFSMLERDGRYRITESGALGDWIIKTPSRRHKSVPLNEYTAMNLARLAGVEVPEFRLVDVSTLDQLPPTNLPDEQYAFAIRRFDRCGQARIHTEDFAQVFVQYAHNKYEGINYEQIGRVLYQYTGDSLHNIQQFARRLLVNILLANGDAHLKNWSLIYPDGVTPELSPAYDIVTTRVYIEDERQYALNLGKTRKWYDVTLAHFVRWAEGAGVPWQVIKPHLADTLDRARTLWPKALAESPMLTEHRQQLVSHWRNLQPDFRIDSESLPGSAPNTLASIFRSGVVVKE